MWQEYHKERRDALASSIPSQQFKILKDRAKARCVEQGAQAGALLSECEPNILFLHLFPPSLPPYLPTYLPTYLHPFLPPYLPTYLPPFLPIYPPTYLSSFLPASLPLSLPPSFQPSLPVSSFSGRGLHDAHLAVPRHLLPLHFPR